MQQLLGKISLIEGTLAAMAYAITASLLLVDIIAREVWRSPFLGAQKWAILSAIIASTLGLSMAVANNAHLRANFTNHLLPFCWADRLGDLVSAILYAGLTWYALVFVQESMAFKDQAEVIYISLWPFQLVLPYAFLMCSLRHWHFFVSPKHKPPAVETS